MVDGGAVVVVARVLDVVEPLPDVVVVAPELPEFPEALVVVVVVGGATNVFVSPCSVAMLVDGLAERLVQLRALFQLLIAAVAGCPLNGWGRPDTMVAGRQTAPVICLPWAEMMSDPLSVSGAALS